MLFNKKNNNKIHTKGLFIVPVGYVKKTASDRTMKDYSIITGEMYDRQIFNYQFIPMDPHFFVCVKKDNSKEIWVDILSGDEYEMFDTNLRDGSICISSKIVPISKYFSDPLIDYEILKNDLAKLNKTASLEKEKIKIEEYLEDFKEFAKTNPEVAKKLALEVLLEIGVLNKDGSLKEQIVTSSQHHGKDEQVSVKKLGVKPSSNK